MTAHEAAYAAQRIETELLGQQCGIQDQLCCAYGGITLKHVNKVENNIVAGLDGGELMAAGGAAGPSGSAGVSIGSGGAVARNRNRSRH